MLDMFLWDNFPENQVNQKIKFWADYWKISIDSFTDNEHGLGLNSPRTLLLEVLSEIQLNNLRNDKVKSYFKGEVHAWLSKKNVIGDDVHLLLQQLSDALKKENHSYIHHLCLICLRVFENDHYSDKLTKNLVTALMHGPEDEFTHIKQLSEQLIIELLYKGYHPKEISKIPQRLFDNLNEYAPGLWSTTYPSSVSILNFKISNNAFDYHAYSEALKLEQATLTIQNRLEALSYFYKKEKKKYRVIFPITGVTSSTPITVGPVVFYAPNKTKYYNKGSSVIGSEMFGKDENPNALIYSNGTTEVLAIDTQEAIETASIQIDMALSILRFHQNTTQELVIDKNHYLVFDDNNASISHSSSGVNHPISYHESIRSEFFTENSKAAIIKLGSLISKSGTISRVHPQVLSVLHWIKKSEEEKRVEDCLLNLWIVIEKMFPDHIIDTRIEGKKIDTILELVPHAYINRARYRIGWKLFGELRKMVGTSQNGRTILSLPKDLLERSHLDPHLTGRKYLRNFVNCIDEIDIHTDRVIIKEKIQFIKSFYTENDFAADTLQSMIRNTHNDLLMAYRFRNKIVHDAHFDDRLLPYYISKLKKYVYALTSDMIDMEENSIFLDRCLEYKAKNNLLLMSLRKNKNIDLLSELEDIWR